MVRLQELHQLLFYLVRDYSGNPSLDQDQAWEQLYRDNSSLKPLKVNDLPRIYRAELSWRWAPEQLLLASLEYQSV